MCVCVSACLGVVPDRETQTVQYIVHLRSSESRTDCLYLIAGVPVDTGDPAQQLHQVEGGKERRHALLHAQGDD